MVFLVVHLIIYVFFHSSTLLLPHPQPVIQCFSSSHPILSAALYCLKTCLLTGLLEASLMVAKGEKLMGLKMVGLQFQSMEAIILM